MVQATGTHQIMNFGADIMRLYDSQTAQVVVYAHRTEGGVWHVHTGPSEEEEAEGVDVPTRPDAITKMVELATELLGGGGIACQVPWGLPEMP